MPFHSLFQLHHFFSLCSPIGLFCCRARHHRLIANGIGGSWYEIRLSKSGGLCNGMQSMARAMCVFRCWCLMFISKCIKSLEYPQWSIKNESAATQNPIEFNYAFLWVDSPVSIVFDFLLSNAMFWRDFFHSFVAVIFKYFFLCNDSH